MVRDRLYLGNVSPDASLDEIKLLVEKYALGEVYNIEKVDLRKEGEEHAYLISIHYQELQDLNNTVTRMHDLWWKERHLFAHLM